MRGFRAHPPPLQGPSAVKLYTVQLDCTQCGKTVHSAVNLKAELIRNRQESVKCIMSSPVHKIYWFGDILLMKHQKIKEAFDFFEASLPGPGVTGEKVWILGRQRRLSGLVGRLVLPRHLILILLGDQAQALVLVLLEVLAAGEAHFGPVSTCNPSMHHFQTHLHNNFWWFQLHKFWIVW